MKCPKQTAACRVTKIGESKEVLWAPLLCRVRSTFAAQSTAFFIKLLRVKTL
jgi:hypothetical protein